MNFLTRVLMSAALALACACLARADSPPESPRPSVSPEVRPVLDRELGVVRHASSVQGKTTSVWEMQTEGGPPIRTEFVTEYAVAKPGRLFMDTRDLTVYADGTALTVYCKSLKQYRQRPMPTLDTLRATIEEMTSGQIRNIPGEPLLLPRMPLEETLRGIRSVDAVREGEFNGEKGLWVSGVAFDERNPAGGDFTFERFYAAGDGLVRAINQDWTAMYQSQTEKHHAEQNEGNPNPEPIRNMKHARWTITYQRQVNSEIPAERFTFSPAAEDQRVEEFIFLRPSLKEQVALIGKPLPDLRGTDFDGKPLNLADFKGKVLLMDFWATWCGPCVQGLPSMQEIKARYADKPFAMLGVNRDKPGSGDRVMKFLAKRGLTIPQLDDTAGKAADYFHAVGIPMVVLVDKDGIVQDIDVGYLPGKEKQTAAKVEKLLSGQPIRTPEELRAYRKQVGLPAE